jgi:hypothetical protein
MGCFILIQKDFLSLHALFGDSLSDGVIGNTSDFGSEESRFDSWSDNGINLIVNLTGGDCGPLLY